MSTIQVSRDDVLRLWLACQGLLHVADPPKITRSRFVRLLEETGGLQVDSVNVVDRAHYLTLWSRFGNYNRKLVDKWVYRDRVAYEYWGHEASILPLSHLPYGLRRMSRFPPDRWRDAAYWSRYNTSDASKRRVLQHIRKFGPLESLDFERTVGDDEMQRKVLGWGSLIPKEDKRSLNLLWHAGKLAISERRSFRKVFDLAANVYPQDVRPVRTNEYFDSWLLVALRGCGVASETHLANYFTGPNLKAPERKSVIARAIKQHRIVSVRVEGCRGQFYALPEHLDALSSIEAPTGTTLICPFDSLLWQRKRAEDLLDFEYRVEIYVPGPKRKFGYYVMPILHDGRLVGRIDPKLHRDQGMLEIKSVHFEPWFRVSRSFRDGLQAKLEDLASFLGATDLRVT